MGHVQAPEEPKSSSQAFHTSAASKSPAGYELTGDVLVPEELKSLFQAFQTPAASSQAADYEEAAGVWEAWKDDLGSCGASTSPIS